MKSLPQQTPSSEWCAVCPVCGGERFTTASADTDASSFLADNFMNSPDRSFFSWNGHQAFWLFSTIIPILAFT